MTDIVNTSNNVPQIIDSGFKIYTMSKFMETKLKPLVYLIDPLVPECGVSLLYAERGAGKTFMALSLACAAASGFDFLNFKVPAPCKVLYIDGEMDAREIQSRLSLLIKGFEKEGKTVNQENLRLFLFGMQNGVSMPNLAIKEEQLAVEKEIADAQLIIIDNISCLYTSYGKENEHNTWIQYNEWSREQRGKGRAVLWCHHCGKDKNRGPRGSSSIENILNYSMALSVPEEHTADQGLCVTVSYAKSRGKGDDSVKEFCAKLVSPPDNSYLQWQMSSTTRQKQTKQVQKLQKDGMSLQEISKFLGISKSTAQRMSKEST